MTSRRSIPLGSDRKDPPWQWGAFFIGLCAIAVLVWITTLGDVDLVTNRWWFVSLVLGLLFSMRYGMAWRRGDDLGRERRPRRHEPVVDVRGESGSTYVVVESSRPRSRVRPREFTPGWWALYSVFVRAPMALGDLVLTQVWRLAGGFGATGTGALARELEDELYAEQQEAAGRPDRERF